PGSKVPLPCRAWVSVADKRLFLPATESCTAYARDRSFSCDGFFVIEAPAGNAVIHIERGKEYRPIDKEVVVQPNQTTNVDITLERWVNMSREGWYSADIHCHFGLGDLRVLKQLALADDINFEPLLTLWNHQTKTPAGSWPDWPGGSSIQADATHVVTFRNQEIERIGGDAFESTGALLMFGLTKPVEMPPGNSRYPCDAVLGRAAKETSPECVIDTDKPIWGENVVGVALGLFDSVQVCHNHYHRDATLQMGRVGWGMAGADIEEDRKVWAQDELFHRTNSTYYRFLNCGFRLAATGGSAMGVMAVPLGYSRTYAKLDGPLTEANYLKAIRAGRTFATSGPMLTLTANGLDCGTEIRYTTAASKPIRIEAKLRSIQSIDSLELVANGKVIKSVSLKNRPSSPVLEESIALAFEPRRSGWVATRAIFTAPDGHLRQAHTSPIYITVDGKPTASKTDAEYMIRWIDRLMQVTDKPGRYKTDTERSQVQAVYQQARQKYQDIARQAVESWGDIDL
ncbi:MAG TPA: CehA/McbA family metallohydrolase, partial [Sedimentisphaerales bacterium]|nr:CehA/McbA family metallohydrolase [Sedimentisphaerales bacterium]